MSNVKVITNSDDIVAVANAIRSKIGETKNMTLGEMASNIQKMSVGGGDGGQDLGAEIAAQKELIAQLDSILDGKASGGSDADLVEEINAQKELIAELSSILDSKAAGGSGIDGGYSVTFVDNDDSVIAVFSVLPDVPVQAPVYSVRNWEDEAGDLIIFPYTPNGSIVLRPVPPALSDDMYAFYGLDVGEYPYFMIWARNSTEAKIYFATKKSDDGFSFSGDVYYGTASMSGVDISDADAVAAACRTALPSLSSLTRTTGIMGPYDGSGMYFYTNYDITVSSGTFVRID